MSPDFISAVEALPDKTYLVSVPKDTHSWLKRPMTITKTYQWGGKTRTKTLLADPDSAPLAVEELTKNINDYFWYKENAERILMLRSFYKSGRWNQLKQMANSHLSLLAV